MKTTLQIRLISLLVLSSLFLMAAFTMIQLNNQIQKTREFNIYQARQEALTTRDRLKSIFATYSEETARGSLLSETKSVFNSLFESGVIETASLLDKDGRPVVLEGDLKLFFEDTKSQIDQITKTRDDKSRWITPVIDKDHKLINLFVIFENPYGYFTKLSFSLDNVQKALNAVYGPVIFTIIIVIVGNIVLGALLSWVVISPIKILNEATKDVASGNLDLKIYINTKDELEELADTFNLMTVELKKMKMKAENANPLTKLPGNVVIQEEVEARINGGKKFVLIYSDLDHFKAFNDKYGVHAGDKAIMIAADVMKEALAKKGQSGDFLGHEGGDDFLLLTEPERAEAIAFFIIEEFCKRIKSLYSKEDLDKGCIEAKGRESDQVLQFPLMTISLAGVGNTKRNIKYYSELTNIAAEVKKAVKKSRDVKFMIDKRGDSERPVSS